MKATVFKPSALGLAVMLSLGAAGAANAKSFVMQAASGGAWGAAEDAAVASAGGKISFKHANAGIAVVESDNANFLKAAQRNGKIKGEPDVTVQWQKPSQTFEVEADSVNYANDNFINLQWNLDAVQAKQAWAAPGGYTGAGVRVAVLDGGIWNSHVDLINKVDAAHSASFVTGFAFNQDVGTFWHGTHVAGIIAAEDNTTGTVGIAPGATIVGVKVLHNGSGSFGAVIAGILYAADPIDAGGGGADIINMSLGALFPRAGGKKEDNEKVGTLLGAMAKAVNYATARNVLVVSAAGNDATDLDHSQSWIDVPAQSGNGLAVAATGPEGFAVGWPNGATNYSDPASYTNYGTSAVWVSAPGGDARLPGSAICAIPRVVGAPLVNYCWVFDLVLSTSRGSGASTTSYSFAAGTSMAAPAAAAVAALIKERHPGISVGDLKTDLAATAVGEKNAFNGKGFVNALNAVTQ